MTGLDINQHCKIIMFYRFFRISNVYMNVGIYCIFLAFNRLPHELSGVCITIIPVLIWNCVFSIFEENSLAELFLSREIVSSLNTLLHPNLTKQVKMWLFPQIHEYM